MMWQVKYSPPSVSVTPVENHSPLDAQVLCIDGVVHGLSSVSAGPRQRL